MKASHPLLPEPLGQKLKPLCAVFTAFVFQFTADQQRRIKLLFGNIDTKDRFRHKLSLL
jgi:hypothetical protein